MQSGRKSVRQATISAILAGTLAMTGSALLAETEVSVYGGVQTSPHSRVFVDDPDGIGTTDFLVNWQGRSFEMPPYYGVRATWWRNQTLGFGLDFAHNKVYAPDSTLSDEGFTTLEFSDGINILTANAYRRWQDSAFGLTPYIGGGFGISVPRVEVTAAGTNTDEYQFTGPAATVIAGASYPVSSGMSIFGEYKGTYSQNTADLEAGGTLETDIVTNALNVGVSFSF